VIAAGALLGLALPVCADEEAVCADGRRVRGTLTVADDGALRFAPSGQDKPLPPGAVEGVRFDATNAVTPRAGNSVQGAFANGQFITGELLQLDGARVRLRPAWADRVELKRDAVTALTHPPGYRTLFADDPTRGAKAWKSAGDVLSYELPAPLEAGRVGVTLQGKDKDGRCRLEAVFQSKAGERRLILTAPGKDENYQVEATGLKGEAREVRQSPGPHQLVVQFSKGSLRVTCDDDVLWYNVEQGPGGALKQVRLIGEGTWSAFCLAKAVDEPRRPPGDAEQDEVWLASDDQLFGTITGADARTVELEGRFGKRTIAWADVRGLYFRRAKAPAAKPAPNTVRVWFRTGFGNETDILEGVLLKIDERQFVLKHAELGELRLDCKWLREVRPRADTQ
jgi:hypothetical protein